MQFTRLFAFVFTLFSLGLMVHASPALTERQADQSEISSIMTTLHSSVYSVVPKIKALDPSTANVSDVAPYLTQLETAFTTAGSSLSSLASSKRSVEVVDRQTTPFDEELAALVATLLEDIAAALDGLLGVPGLGSLLPGLAGPINTVLVGLETLLAGVLTLVSALLVDVAALLTELGVGLTTASLGL